MSIEGITYLCTWQTIQDERRCEICATLDGREWELLTLEGTLEDPAYGALYDLDADLSLVHFNCRCFLHIQPIVTLENTAFYRDFRTDLTQWGYMPSNIEEAKVQVAELGHQIEITYTDFRMFQRVLQRSLYLLKLAGLPPEAEQAIRVMTRAIWAARMLTVSLHALSAASGPIGWANALLGLAVGAVTAGEAVSEMSAR